MGRCRQDFWGTCSAIHREIARPVPSSATLTDHERSKRKSRFTKQDTDTDRLLVAACRQGHPCRSCAHEDLWSQGSRHGSTPHACVVGASPKTRAVVLLYWLRKVACFLIFTSITKKQCQISFLLTQHFRFFLLFLAAAEVEPGIRVCVGTAATPVQGQSCLHSNFIHHVLVCTAQQ